MSWNPGETFHVGAVFRQRVFHDAEIEAGDDHVVPMVADSAQGHIQHGYNSMSERFMAIERYCAKELLALCITGVMRAGVRLERCQIDSLPDASRYRSEEHTSELQSP